MPVGVLRGEARRVIFVKYFPFGLVNFLNIREEKVSQFLCVSNGIDLVGDKSQLAPPKRRKARPHHHHTTVALATCKPPPLAARVRPDGREAVWTIYRETFLVTKDVAAPNDGVFH